MAAVIYIFFFKSGITATQVPTATQAVTPTQAAPSPTTTQAPVQYNTMDPNKVNANGEYLIDLEGGGTAEYMPNGYVRITGADSNGNVKIPAAILDQNKQNVFSPGQGNIQFSQINGLKTIDVSEITTINAGGIVSILDSAVVAGNNQIEKISNSNTSAEIDLTNKRATVTPNNAYSPRTEDFGQLVSSVTVNNYSNYYDTIKFGDTTVTWDRNNKEYNIKGNGQSYQASMQGNGNLSAYDDSANSQVELWSGGTVCHVGYDGTLKP